MSRYYGDRYIYELKSQIRKMPESMEISSYRIITGGGPSVEPEVMEPRRWADTAADKAASNMRTIRDKFSELNDVLTAYYTHVNEVSEEIYDTARDAYTVFNDSLKALSRLEQLLLSSKTVDDLDQNEITSIFDPVRRKMLEQDSHMVKMLLTKRSELDKSTKESLIYMLETMGVSGVTENDLSTFCIVYDQSSKTHDHEWIMNHLEMIFSDKKKLNEIANVGRYSSSAQTACIDGFMKTLEGRDKDIDKFRYSCLYSRIQADGKIDPASNYRLQQYLKNKNCDISSSKTREFAALIKDFDNRGISFDVAYSKFKFLCDSLSVQSLYDDDGKINSGVVENIISDCLKSCFYDIPIGREAEEAKFYNTFLNNTTIEDRVSYLNFFQRLDNGENIPVQERIDFTLDFAMKFIGYEDYMDGGVHYDSDGTPHDNQFTYFGTVYGKNPWAWCAMFTNWMLDKGGLLDEIAVPGINHENAMESGMAGADAYGNYFSNKSRFLSKDETPSVGDIAVFREYHGKKINRYHVAFVVGVDNDKIYTLEGNAAAPVYHTDDHASELADAKRDGVKMEDDGHHQIRLKTYPRDYERIEGYCQLGGTEKSTRLIDDKRDMISDGYDFREIYMD